MPLQCPVVRKEKNIMTTKNKNKGQITNPDESIGRYRRSVIIDGSKLPENITGPVKLTVL